MIREEIRLEISAGYTCLFSWAPPSVMCWMKKEEKMAPMGCRPPRKAAAMPLKPMAGTLAWVTAHCSKSDRYSIAAPMPARPPAMAMVSMMLCRSCMPQYLAAFLLRPVARSS